MSMSFTVHLQLHYRVALVHNSIVQSIELQSFAILLLYTVFCLRLFINVKTCAGFVEKCCVPTVQLCHFTR
jgi:uncharacterized membrane protein YesL